MTNKRVAFLLLFFYFLFPLSAQSALSTKKQAPGFQEITKWLGTETPITEKKLLGKVVLVSFWSPCDIKSLWEMNILSQWYERYSPSVPFTVLTIAVPKFEFEKDISKTEPAIRKLKLPFPVALDPEQKLWKAYGARSIPTYFLIDANGLIRGSYSQEINYTALEDTIQNLLKEAYPKMPFIEKTKIPSFKNFPVFFLGYRTLSGYGGNEKIQSERVLTFNYPDKTDTFHFYLSGNWIAGEESLRSAPPLSSIKILFDSSSAFIVAGTNKKGLIPAEVRLDGNPITKEIKGKDIVIQEGKSYVFIKDYRLYKLLKSKNPSSAHTLELIFEEPGIELFSAGFE